MFDGAVAPAAAAAVGQQLAGLSAVVVLGPDPTAQAVGRRVRGSSALLVTAQGADTAATPTGGALILRPRSGSGLGVNTAADFQAAYRRAYRRAPSAAAALGYDAGRLIDAAVAGADDGIEDPADVIRSAVRRADVLLSSDLVAPPDVSSPAATVVSPAASPSGSGTVWALPSAAVAGAVLVGWVLLRRRRRA